MATWETVLLGIVAILFVVWMFPSVRHQMLNSPKGTAEDWKGVIIPLLLVALFVIFLITLVK